jgi:hypothetical protein
MSATDPAYRVAIEAGLWFSYSRAKRPEVTASTTFEALLRGERTSTTRFARWPGHEAWTRVVPGDLIRFHEFKDRSGRTAVAKVSSVIPISLCSCCEAEIEVWSRCEGWSPERGRALGRDLGTALWFRHGELIWPAREAPPVPAQGSLF